MKRKDTLRRPLPQRVLPERPRFVSRGGIKLDHALVAFGLSVRGAVALDVGASTGGFTDRLLQGGAARVYAVDVGKGLLDWGLRRDPRVAVRDRVHAARLSAEEVPEPVDIATVDVSFISLRRVLPAVAKRLSAGGSILALVKPQFEAPRRAVRDGVIRDPEVHRAVLRDLAGWVSAQGWSLRGVTPSPLRGPKGNREFFFWIAPAPDEGLTAPEAAIDAAVREAHA